MPKTDLLFFFQGKPGQDEGEIVAKGKWDRVCQIVGHLMRLTDRYPVRYRVNQFPNAEQLAAIGMED